MATATKEKPETKKVEKVTFRSNRPWFTQTLIPADFDLNNKGLKYNITNGLRAEFGPTHTFETDDPETIALMRGSDNYNREFHEIGREPGREIPSASDQLAAIAKASVAKDADAIGEIVRVEAEAEEREIEGFGVRQYGGYNRPEVLAAAEAALSAIAGE